MLGERRRADQVYEQDADFVLLALESDAGFERLASHLLTDVAAEQFTHLLPLAQARRHVVEPGLQKTDLTVVVNRDVGVELALRDAIHAMPDVGEWIGN